MEKGLRGKWTKFTMGTNRHGSFEVCGMYLLTPVMDLIQRPLFFMRPYFSLCLCQCNSPYFGRNNTNLYQCSGGNFYFCFSAQMLDNNFHSLFPFLLSWSFSAGAVPLIFLHLLQISLVSMRRQPGLQCPHPVPAPWSGCFSPVHIPFLVLRIVLLSSAAFPSCHHHSHHHSSRESLHPPVVD